MLYRVASDMHAQCTLLSRDVLNAQNVPAAWLILLEYMQTLCVAKYSTMEHYTV